MAKQIHLEDAEVGSEIPPLVKHPTPVQLVMWAGASGDYNPIHFDKDIALGQGLPDIIVHGRLKSAFLCQMLTDWIGEQGFLKKLSCQHRGVDFPGKDLVCKGKVVRKYVQDSHRFLECEVWTENMQGQRTTVGSATVILPSVR